MIMKKAEAEQKGMQILGEALQMECGDEVVKMQLAQKYMENIR